MPIESSAPVARAPGPNRICDYRDPSTGKPACAHREVSEHKPPVPGVPSAPRPCLIAGCPCRNFVAPAPPEPLTTARSAPTETRAPTIDRVFDLAEQELVPGLAPRRRRRW